MACTDPNTLPIIEQVSLALTQIPIGTDSLPPFSVKPVIFTRYPDAVITGNSDVHIFWSPGSYRPSDGSIDECDLIHAPRASMHIRFEHSGIDTFVYITAESRGKIYSESYRLISNSLIAVQLSLSSAYKCYEPFKLYRSTNNLLGMIQELVLGADAAIRDEEMGSIVERVLEFDPLFDIWRSEISINCLLDYETREVDITEENMDADADFYLHRTISDLEMAAIVAANLIVTAGEILSGNIPTSAILPTGGCSYIEYEILEEQQVVRPARVYRRSQTCDYGWIESKVDFSGVCIGVDWPDEEPPEPPEPPPLAPNLPPGAIIAPIPPPPPSTSTEYPGLGWETPPEYIPCEFIHSVCASGTAKRANVWEGCTPETDEDRAWKSAPFRIIDESDIIIERGVLSSWPSCPHRQLHWTTVTLKEVVCDPYTKSAIRTGRRVLATGDWFHMPQYNVDGPHQIIIGGCNNGPCSTWLVEIIMTSNGLPPYPAGLKIRNYIHIECGSAPGLSYQDGIAYITCGGEPMGPIGWAASTYRWFQFSLGMVVCKEQ